MKYTNLPLILLTMNKKVSFDTFTSSRNCRGERYGSSMTIVVSLGCNSRGVM